MDSDNKKTLRMLAVIGALIVIILGYNVIKPALNVLISALTPFVIGILLALILNIPTRFFENKVFRKDWKKCNKLKRILSIIISLMIFVAIISAVAILIVPRITSMLMELGGKIPDTITRITTWAHDNFELSEEIAARLDELKVASASWGTLLGYTFDKIPDIGIFSSSILNIVKTALSSLTAVGVAIFFALYALSQKEKISGFFKKCLKTFLKPEHEQKTAHFFDVLHRCFEDFIHGQVLECFLVALIFTVLALIFGFKCALITGVVMFFLAFIPYVGNLLACGIGAVMTIVMESPVRAIWFIALFAVVQFLDGNFMYPRVMGLKVEMPPFAIFVVAILSGGLFGVAGIILSIPIATAFYLLLKEKMVAKGVETAPSVEVSHKPEKRSKRKEKK